MNFFEFSAKKKRPPLVLPGGVILHFSQPLVMSIVNCTPDSFYEPSRAADPEEAAERALTAESEGADIIDFGAESTRPGAVYLDEEEETRRLIPVLRRFRRQSALPVSVDTRNASTARQALDEGADMVNDVSALSDPAMTALCAEREAAVVLMHGFQRAANTVEEVKFFLLERAERAAAGGIGKEKIILDPGFGFGKSTVENLVLLNRLERMSSGDYPFLVGLSRKRFTGEITGREPEGRLAGTIAAGVFAILGGADIIRIHDTSAAVDMIKMITAITQGGSPE
ncbi:MAG: dihydropteroate synthase [Treponema sp.]|nr:dihydropteroate synthase [Treponema sp.]